MMSCSTTWRRDGHPDHEATAASLRERGRFVQRARLVDSACVGLSLCQTGGRAIAVAKSVSTCRSKRRESDASALRSRPMRVSCSRIPRRARTTILDADMLACALRGPYRGDVCSVPGRCRRRRRKRSPTTDKNAWSFPHAVRYGLRRAAHTRTDRRWRITLNTLFLPGRSTALTQERHG